MAVFVSRLVQSCLDDYLGLHYHLMSVANSSDMPWSHVQHEIDYHVKKLRIPRKNAQNRIQALCGVYIYLRDAATANWHSHELQNKRNREMYSLISNAGTGSSGIAICTKCNTAMHGGGRTQCPWKLLTDKLARKSGIEMMIECWVPSRNYFVLPFHIFLDKVTDMVSSWYFCRVHSIECLLNRLTDF
jgi:hypothetical protein